MTRPDKFARARHCFRLELLATERLRYELERGRNLYGVAGNAISGGFFPHWPDNVKRKIRRLNRMQIRLQDAGFQARPPYVRWDTMRQLRLVTITETIRAQHALVYREPHA